MLVRGISGKECFHLKHEDLSSGLKILCKMLTITMSIPVTPNTVGNRNHWVWLTAIITPNTVKNPLKEIVQRTMKSYIQQPPLTLIYVYMAMTKLIHTKHLSFVHIQ